MENERYRAGLFREAKPRDEARARINLVEEYDLAKEDRVSSRAQHLSNDLLSR